jgi:hypothetical protein
MQPRKGPSNGPRSHPFGVRIWRADYNRLLKFYSDALRHAENKEGIALVMRSNLVPERTSSMRSYLRNYGEDTMLLQTTSTAYTRTSIGSTQKKS